MTLTKKSLLSLIIAGALFVGFLAGLSYFKNAKEAVGSVFIGNEYQATTTDATWSTATLKCKDTLTGNKTLGSIVIPFTSNANIDIYDATTTGPHADHATTTIASFPSTAAGTYTFDVRLKRGLCVVVTNAAGEGIASSTITFRP